MCFKNKIPEKRDKSHIENLSGLGNELIIIGFFYVT